MAPPHTLLGDPFAGTCVFGLLVTSLDCCTCSVSFCFSAAVRLRWSGHPFQSSQTNSLRRFAHCRSLQPLVGPQKA